MDSRAEAVLQQLPSDIDDAIEEFRMVTVDLEHAKVLGVEVQGWQVRQTLAHSMLRAIILKHLLIGGKNETTTAGTIPG